MTEFSFLDELFLFKDAVKQAVCGLVRFGSHLWSVLFHRELPTLILKIYLPVRCALLFFWTELCFPLWFRMAHVLHFDEQTRKVKDANMQDEDTFEIYDPRNPVNKRRREESKKLMKEKKARRWDYSYTPRSLLTRCLKQPVWNDSCSNIRGKSISSWEESY